MTRFEWQFVRCGWMVTMAASAGTGAAAGAHGDPVGFWLGMVVICGIGGFYIDREWMMRRERADAPQV